MTHPTPLTSWETHIDSNSPSAEVCVCETCSYFSGEVHVRRCCSIRCRPHIFRRYIGSLVPTHKSGSRKDSWMTVQVLKWPQKPKLWCCAAFSCSTSTWLSWKLWERIHLPDYFLLTSHQRFTLSFTEFIPPFFFCFCSFICIIFQWLSQPAPTGAHVLKCADDSVILSLLSSDDLFKN